MTLILSNEEIESIFTLEECFDVLEPALLDLGNGAAVNMPRQDLLVPGPLDGSYHGLKTSCASLPRAGVTSMRVTSDVLTWPMVGGRQRRVKVPLATGNKYVGLVFIFSTATGELLAIFPDGLMQAIRVGVTNALSAKYLARGDSTIMALYGSGWQARPALTAMCKVLPIREIRVFSPTKENRDAFVHSMRERIEAELRSVSSPEAAANGADIVALATNALDPFFSSAWIRDGMHITTVRPSEMTLDALVRCDLIAVSTREAARFLRYPVKKPRFLNSARAITAARSWKTPPPIGATSPNCRKSWPVKWRDEKRTERSLACSITLGLDFSSRPPPQESMSWRKRADWDESCPVNGSVKKSTHNRAV